MFVEEVGEGSEGGKERNLLRGRYPSEAILQMLPTGIRQEALPRIWWLG
jgi:hypothetical protein